MSKVFTIYHNPNCSKSRATLDLLKQQEVAYSIVYYLKQSPSEETLVTLLQQLQMPARALMRKNEAIYKDNHLKDSELSEQQLIEWMLKFPKLIERPIVSDGNRAIIGRPPENLLQLF